MTVKMNKILIKSALVFSALIVLGLVARGILNFTTGKRLDSAIKEMKTEGKRLAVQDFEPRCRDVDNAALLWQGIEAMFVKDFNSPAVINSPMKTLAEGKPLDPLTRTRVAETAGKYEMIFQLIRQASEKPCFKYARRWKNASFGLKHINLKKLAPLFRLFLLNVYLQAEKGEKSQALQDLRSALRNLSFLFSEPHPFNRMENWMLAYEHLNVLRAVMRKGIQDEQTCRSVLEELARFTPKESLKLSLQLEQAMALEEYVSYLHGEIRGNLSEKAGRWLFKPRLKSEALFCLNLWKDAEKAFSEPYYGDQEWLKLYQEKTKNIPRHYQLARIFHSSSGPWLLAQCARLEAMIDVIGTATACRLYLLQHGRFPETLGQLSPAILAAIPVDPFTGRSLVYRRRPKGFILYSLGLNQKDDEGQGTWGRTFWAFKAGDDIAWEE